MCWIPRVSGIEGFHCSTSGSQSNQSQACSQCVSSSHPTLKEGGVSGDSGPLPWLGLCMPTQVHWNKGAHAHDSKLIGLYKAAWVIQLIFYTRQWCFYIPAASITGLNLNSDWCIQIPLWVIKWNWCYASTINASEQAYEPRTRKCILVKNINTGAIFHDHAESLCRLCV